MQDVFERNEGVARNLANLCLLDERVVEQAGGIVLLFLVALRNVLAVLLLLLLRHGARDVEPHFHKLVPRTA